MQNLQYWVLGTKYLEQNARRDTEHQVLFTVDCG